MTFSIIQSKILIDSAVVTILNGQSESNATDLQGATAVGLQFPSLITGATVSFLSSETLGGVYLPVNDDTGTLISATIIVDTVAGFPPAVITALLAVRFIKVKSNVTQGADALITINVRQL